MPPRPLAVLNSLVLLVAMLTVGVSPSWSAAPPPASQDAPVSPVPDAPADAEQVEPPPPAEPMAEEPPAEQPSPDAPDLAAPAAGAPAPASPAAPPPPPKPRVVYSTGYQPYASVGPVVLHTPGDVVELIGYHQSGHDGAQPQQPVQGGKRIGLLGSRARDTDGQGAADIVVDPTRQVRSPVTGTVLRGGTYALYCDHVDEYVVVEPDARPGWEVKVLHFEGLRVAKGERVQAGVTVIGTRARVLPFASQVDKHTVAPHWPHLHVEVVDPSIPDRPSGGGC
jgi:hypothetical protein